jgi:hypothetical protein
VAAPEHVHCLGTAGFRRRAEPEYRGSGIGLRSTALDQTLAQKQLPFDQPVACRCRDCPEHLYRFTSRALDNPRTSVNAIRRDRCIDSLVKAVMMP